MQRTSRSLRLHSRQSALIKRRRDPRHDHAPGIQLFFGPLPILARRLSDVLVPELTQLCALNSILSHDVERMAQIGIDFVGDDCQLHKIALRVSTYNLHTQKEAGLF